MRIVREHFTFNAINDYWRSTWLKACTTFIIVGFRLEASNVKLEN